MSAVSEGCLVPIKTCVTCGNRVYIYRSETDADGQIVRYRLCDACGTRFKTIETFVKILNFD